MVIGIGMVARLRRTVELKSPVGRLSARIAATGIAALALADCGGYGCGELTAIGQCASPPPREDALGVAVADFNRDGQPDVAIPLSYGGHAPGAVGIYQHLSSSGKNYAAREDYTVGGDPYTIIADELNGDGSVDLVTGDPRFATVKVLLNSAGDPGIFDAVQSLSAVRVTQVAAADMNGDGLPDLIIAARPLLLSLQNINSLGTFAPPVTLFSDPRGEIFRSLAVSDLNGDGTPDIAVADDSGVSVLFSTSSTGTPAIASASMVYVNARSGEFPAIAVADVNSDGLDDLVIADAGGARLAVLEQSGAVAGEFLPASVFDLPAGAGLSVVVADLDGDSYPDIVSGGSALVAVLLQDATRPGAFPEAINYSAPIAANAVAVADIDGDGLLDIVTNSGVTSTNDGGVLRTPPGVLYQDSSRPGSFLALQNLR
jgi:hypothetical protein